jgi:hypothetical protein
MIAGHFGFAAAVKARERSAPLWALMLGCVWLDVVFVPLFAMKIETITPAPGTSGGYGAGIIYADYTHSLVGALMLSVIFGGVAAIPWGRRVGTVLGAVVFSHWVLDLVMHRGDMPWLPGNAGNLPRMGFGLWRAPVASALVELALVAVGSYLYWRAARSTGKLKRADLAAAVVLMSGVLVLALDFTGIVG